MDDMRARRIEELTAAVETLRRLATEAGIEAAIGFHAGAVPPLLPPLPNRYEFVACLEGGHHYCKSFDLAGRTLIVAREATVDEVDRLARCKQQLAAHVCQQSRP